jgi:DNA-binding MarR family transcriptional regulator
VAVIQTLLIRKRRVETTLLTPIEVAQQLRISQSGMMGKLDRLEDQGLIDSTADPDNRRAIRLAMTEAGTLTAAQKMRGPHTLWAVCGARDLRIMNRAS